MSRRSHYKRRKNGVSYADPALLDGQQARTSFIDVRKKTVAEDEMMGFEELLPGNASRVGWLINMAPAIVEDPTSKKSIQAVDLFFIGDSGEPDFRATILTRPYMYVLVHQESVREAETAIRKQYREQIADVSIVQMEDISAPNHLASEKPPSMLKIECNTAGELLTIRKALLPVITRNKDRRKCVGASTAESTDPYAAASDGLEAVQDIREYDVAPVNRLAIDKKINVGYWYRVSPSGTSGNSSDPPLDADINEASAIEFASASLEKLSEIVERAAPVVLAFDIECTKKPLKFPDADAGDTVMMVSWMVDGRGYLVINREAVSADIEDFEYAPKKDIQGAFEVFNEPNEKAALQRFFQEVRIAAPRVFVTYNGDFFDWPFIEKRASYLGLDMGKEIGMRSVGEDIGGNETRGRTAVHMDVFHWVNRDSYLPQGSRGLKAVTRTLLGFEPEEIPPEEMVEAALKRPHDMAKYSVSDAVCTYFLYMKYVHPFTFSLCNILPLSPDDVLRKGSGTLCEMLLMCQAKDKNIIAPNKFNPEPTGKLTEEGRVMESETYIGGHVEALRTGIYRSDLPLKFSVDTATIEELEARIDETLRYAITVEAKLDLKSVNNYDEIRSQVLEKLKLLRETPIREEKPLIYHLDVSAMYPNIILTNRLQPHAIVTSNQCAACDFNGTSDCQRNMSWTWRGEFYPASRGESEMIYRRATAEQREVELKAAEAQKSSGFGPGKAEKKGNGVRRTQNLSNIMGIKVDYDAPGFDEDGARNNPLFRKRLKEFCKSQYKRATVTREDSKIATVCQRENPFYVDTVRAFRDRRYEYKALLKKEKKALASLKSSGDSSSIASAEKLVILYDSLQLAHKCILNSFYGYVMRRGARWYSMEMAGIVTNTGSWIIKRAREFIEKVGLPLELDTDGIWCTLPSSFPCNYTFETEQGRKHTMSYIGTVFNEDVSKNFTNHQYQDLVDPETYEYSVRSECSILFEVDGPYRAMVLPASLEEGKSIKKRYAVFNEDGSLAELKGFEIKRRGELKLIKGFQGEIFKKFLEGDTISDCYASVGAVCNAWLDILSTRGEKMDDEALLSLLVEQNNMSKPLEVYLNAGQKSCAITCAQRMAMFLGSDMVQDGGLATMYIIAKKPDGKQVTERAIPSMVFDYKPEAARRRLLQKWTKLGVDADLSLREIIDWDYYRGRLANAILKIVSIPAALQLVDNPVPRIEYPAWLANKVREMKDSRKQRKISSFFQALPKNSAPVKPAIVSMRDSATDTRRMAFEDIEDLPLSKHTPALMAIRRAEAVVTRRKQSTIKARKKYRAYRGFKSLAEDPEERRDETRHHLITLLDRPHPVMRRDYNGWVRHAKIIWKAQRAARVARVERKRSRMEAGFEAVETVKGLKWTKNKRAKSADLLDDDELGGEENPGGVDYIPRNFVADLKSSGGGTFFQRHAPLVGSGVMWQVVSIAPSPASLGEFRLWVLPIRRSGLTYSVGNLHCIPLHAKRTLYVGTKDNESPPFVEGAVVREAKGIKLPRSRKHKSLYSLEVSEDRFRMTNNELSTLRDAKIVEAVYGTKVPLNFQAIVSIGTLCRPRRELDQKQLLSTGLQLHEVAAKDPSKVPYLRESLDESSAPTIFQAFLYGSLASDGSTRAVYLLVAPASKLCRAFVVTPGGAVSDNLRRLWSKLFEEINRNEDGTTDELHRSPVQDLLPDDTKFEVVAYKKQEDAFKGIHAALSELRGGRVGTKHRGAGFRTLVIAQWPESDTDELNKFAAKNGAELALSSTLEESVPAAKLFPVVHVSTNPNDGDYLPIGWERLALTTALSRFAEMGAWLPEQLSVARFAGIPVGNVSMQDVHVQALDTLFGRELENDSQVLWASSSEIPDLGGVEDDDNLFDEEHISVPEHLSAGCHRVVCIDTELSDFAVATVLASSSMGDAEGTDVIANFIGDTNDATGTGSKQNATSDGNIADSGSPLDIMASCAPAFRVLRELVKKWKVTSSHMEHPETTRTCRDLLNHLYRWMRSESSLLFDHALSRFFGWLVKKHFRQLVAELETLGVSIVYASLTRLILATPKTKTSDGLRYTSFLEKTIRSKPIFNDIRFTSLNGVYSGILFVDTFNYAVVPATEEEAILSGEFDFSVKQDSDLVPTASIPNARMIWDIARHLPDPVAALWVQVIEEFIRRPVIHRNQLLERLLKARENQNSAESSSELEAEKKLKQVTSRPRGDGYVVEVQELVGKMTGLLLEKVQEIREKAPQLEFPALPSKIAPSVTRRNPALEFVRSLCYVLSLDSVCSENVAGLRRTLLRLLGVREFAKEAEFVDPAISLPLHDVVCTYCSSVSSLDVGRETRSNRDEGNTENELSVWSCEHCTHPFDLQQIEMDLVGVVQKAYSSYQIQDLICTRCRIAKRDNMSTHCSCSGASFKLAMPQNELLLLLDSYKNVASHYDLQYLLQTASWMTDAVSRT